LESVNNRAEATTTKKDTYAQKGAPRTKAAKKFEIGKRQEIEDLGDPIPDIKLTVEEAKTLKNVVFRNIVDQLDDFYRKAAVKEAKAVKKGVMLHLEAGLYEFGEKKSAEQII